MKNYGDKKMKFKEKGIIGIQKNIKECHKIKEDNRPYYGVETDDLLDNKMTSFGRATLHNRYLLKDEKIQDLFARVAASNSTNKEHAQRMYHYISNHWFMPATPVLSNSGTDRGAPISCFVNESDDSLGGIINTWAENAWLGAMGGGSGTYWGNIRSINETIGNGKTTGKSSGVIPFLHVQDSISLAISQGGIRRASSAFYMRIDHPEIEEFIEMRKPTGGDIHRRCLNSHHGVIIPNSFMEAVIKDEKFSLISPKTGKEIKKVNARDIWIKLLTTRLEQGEPYILYIDNIVDFMPKFQKDLGLTVKTSNLCSEITLPTGIDHLGNHRTAVCCLSSLNLNYWDEYKDNNQFFEDVFLFLDNVLQNFIDNAPSKLHRAVYSAQRERSIGLGVMGWHDFLQEKNIPFESTKALAWNTKIFKIIREQADRNSKLLAKKYGPCLDAQEAGVMERFSCKLSIAPTASISIIAGNSSPGIETINTNAFMQKTLSGTHMVKNKHLKKLLKKLGYDTKETWEKILTNGGSVANLDFLTSEQKEVFKTSFELNQLWVIRHAAARTPYICQSQSVNVFLRPNTTKQELHNIHMEAWKTGLKSLYYCRSMSLQRADDISGDIEVNPIYSSTSENYNKDNIVKLKFTENLEPDVCLACQ